MLPLFSARTRRISKISSCFRMPVAPAISSSLAILVSAEMLISFIADSEITWAGGGAPGLAASPAAGCWPCLPAGASGPFAGAAASPEAALCCLPADPSAALRPRAGASPEAWASLSGTVAVATPPFALGGLRSSSTVRPILRRPLSTRTGRAVETTIRIHVHDACATSASICPPWFQ